MIDQEPFALFNINYISVIFHCVIASVYRFFHAKFHISLMWSVPMNSNQWNSNKITFLSSK